MPRPITSRDNPWFKRFRRAMERHDDEIVIEGRKAIADALELGVEVIAIAGEAEEELARVETRAPKLRFPAPLLNAIADATTHQGLVALCNRPHPAASLTFERGRVVILDAVQDPGNVGTLIRLAAAFWCDAVITTPGCADPFSPKTLRAAVGTTWHLPILELTREAVTALAEEQSLALIAADGQAEMLVGQSAFPARFALVLGSEGQGVSEFFRERASGIRIETDPNVESLNVAAAAAIVLYEATRT